MFKAHDVIAANLPHRRLLLFELGSHDNLEVFRVVEALLLPIIYILGFRISVGSDFRRFQQRVRLKNFYYSSICLRSKLFDVYR